MSYQAVIGLDFHLIGLRMVRIFQINRKPKQRNTAKREHKRSNVPLPALAFLQTGLVPLFIFLIFFSVYSGERKSHQLKLLRFTVRFFKRHKKISWSCFIRNVGVWNTYYLSIDACDFIIDFACQISSYIPSVNYSCDCHLFFVERRIAIQFRSTVR